MKQEFKNWDELYEAVQDENTEWGQLQAHGEEVLVYQSNSNHFLLTDKPINDPNFVEVEL